MSYREEWLRKRDAFKKATKVRDYIFKYQDHFFCWKTANTLPFENICSTAINAVEIRVKIMKEHDPFLK